MKGVLEDFLRRKDEIFQSLSTIQQMDLRSYKSAVGDLKRLKILLNDHYRR